MAEPDLLKRSAELPRDAVFRCIGRNIVNFQYLEATLRSMLPTLAVEWKPSDGQSVLEGTARKHKKSSLGILADAYLDRVFNGLNDPDFDADVPVNEVSIRVSFPVETSPEQRAGRRRALLKLVAERNRLVHKDFLTVDLNSSEECRLLIARLDEQNEHVILQLSHLNALRQAHRAALEEFLRFIQTDEFKSALQGHEDGA